MSLPNNPFQDWLENERQLSDNIPDETSDEENKVESSLDKQMLIVAVVLVGIIMVIR